MGVNFFIRKKTIPGGGGGVRGGVWQKTIRNTYFFFGTLPLLTMIDGENSYDDDDDVNDDNDLVPSSASPP